MDFLLSHILFKLKNCMFHNFLNFIKLIAVPPHCRRRLYTFSQSIIEFFDLLVSTRTNFYVEKAFFVDNISLDI